MTGREQATVNSPGNVRGELMACVDRARDQLIATTRTLVRIPSQTPPSDTRAAVQAVAELISDIDAAVTTIHTHTPPIDNLVSVLRADRPGKRLILNGHLDTYPFGDPASWSDDPISGALRDGKIFGRGACDMKGGVACLLQTFRLLAQNRDIWAGEVVLTLAGDEESMGSLGSQFLLDTVPDAHGDAMLNADVGSPLVPRIGEKGLIWIDMEAAGQSAHGAHVHRGSNAIDKLRHAMDRLDHLKDYSVNAPDEVGPIIAAAKNISEPLGGAGEAEILQEITINYGRIEGGQTANLVPDWARVNADIRLPMGVNVREVETEISRLLAPIEDIQFDITRRYEPTWTSPDDPIVAAVKTACATVLDKQPAINMRVGGSDARIYRAAGIPTVVCGLTPHNLGAADEFVEVDELVDVTKIHLLSALEYLSSC